MPATFNRKTLLALVDASQALNSELDLQEVFKRIAEHAVTVLNAEAASVLLYDENRDELVFQTAVGPTNMPLAGVRFEAGLGIAGQTIKAGRTVCVDDVRRNHNFFAGIDAKTGMRTRSVMAAPLSRRGKVLGVVEVINPSGREKFTEQDIDLLGVFANLATVAASNAQAYQRLTKENRGLRAAHSTPQIIGMSPALRYTQQLCRKVALSNATVLLTGETGTGKELAARAIHAFSKRHNRPFIALNCAALSETLLESELFGHEKGAFTGAVDRRLGKFELADGGTLFLDEVGETSLSIQAKLLRVLQEREFVRVGGAETITCDVRIVGATNRDLKQEMQQGRFREDLFYRLNVFPIRTPPLRERVEDLPLLVDYFISQISPDIGVKPPTVSEEAMAYLTQYSWPGNIRELRNIVERCTLLADGQINTQILPREIVTHSAAASDAPNADQPAAASGSKLEAQERALILKALDETNWNQSRAAKVLQVSRDHLRYRMKKYDLKRP